MGIYKRGKLFYCDYYLYGKRIRKALSSDLYKAEKIYASLLSEREAGKGASERAAHRKNRLSERGAGKGDSGRVAYRKLRDLTIDEFWKIKDLPIEDVVHRVKSLCEIEAKKYKSLTEFREEDGYCYNIAKSLGILSKFTWLFTRKECEKEAKKYEVLFDFKFFSSDFYKISVELNWINSFNWLKSMHWTFDYCYKIACFFDTRGSFREYAIDAYNAAVKNRWLDKFFWFSRPINLYSDPVDSVYAYFFEAQHAVYVGRTINIEQRKRAHKSNYSKTSTVFRFAQENHVSVPEPVILETNITKDEGLKLEDQYRKKFKEEGWEILNIAATGEGSGSLGALGKKWTFRTCYGIACSCMRLIDFKKKNGKAYKAAYRNNWFTAYFWMPPSKKPVRKLLTYS